MTVGCAVVRLCGCAVREATTGQAGEFLAPPCPWFELPPPSLHLLSQVPLDALLGLGMEVAGDADGDGADDLFVGAPGASRLYTLYLTASGELKVCCCC